MTAGKNRNGRASDRSWVKNDHDGWGRELAA
jgi:hypothetical protein